MAVRDIRYDVDEIYPVYKLLDLDHVMGTVVEVPDDLADHLESAWTDFWAAQRELRAYLDAVRKDEHADDRVKAVNLVRLERGQRRPKRRARPS